MSVTNARVCRRKKLVCAHNCSEKPEYSASFGVLTCGDDVISGDETYDDLNPELGDGCKDLCAIEDGRSCSDELGL